MRLRYSSNATHVLRKSKIMRSLFTGSCAHLEFVQCVLQEMKPKRKRGCWSWSWKWDISDLSLRVSQGAGNILVTSLKFSCSQSQLPNLPLSHRATSGLGLGRAVVDYI